MILEVAVIVLFLFWAGTLAMFLAYIKAQRVIAAQQAEDDALRDLPAPPKSGRWRR